MRLPYKGRNLSRQSEVIEQVAAVRRDLDIEYRVARKNIGNWRADPCFRRQNQQSGSISAEPELFRAAKHSFALDTAQFAFANLQSIRQLGAEQRERNFVTDRV